MHFICFTSTPTRPHLIYYSFVFDKHSSDNGEWRRTKLIVNYQALDGLWRHSQLLMIDCTWMNETRFAGFHSEKATNAGNLRPRFSFKGLYVSGVENFLFIL